VDVFCIWNSKNRFMLKKIIITILITLVILKIAEFASEWAVERYPGSKTNYISQKKFDAKIIYHGACEVEWGINPDYLDTLIGIKSYNLAKQGSSFVDNYLDLYVYLKNQQKPEYLFLQVGPESFNISKNDAEVYNYVNYFDDSTVVDVLKTEDSRYMSSSVVPYLKFSFYNNFNLYRVFSGLMHRVANIDDLRYTNGYRIPQGFDSRVNKPFLTKIDENSWNAQEEKYFRKIILLCKSQKIKVILFRTPSYLPYQTLNPFLKQKNKLIQKIASDFELPYFEFDNIEMNKDSSNFFITPCNLSLKGVKKFNDIFSKQLKDSIFK